MSDRLNAAAHTRLDFERTPVGSIERARAFSSATLHEAAGKVGALPHAIRRTATTFKLCGPAVTVQSPGGDNLWLHRAIYAAQPGDVLAVHVSGRYDHGYWGEIMSTAAKVRGLGGLVIDGCVRDADLLPEVGLPVFARGFCIRGTSKDFGARGWINHSVLFGDVVVSPGDLIFGDGDGVVSIPRSRVVEVLEKAARREDDEAAILRRLQAGESTLSVYGWQ